MSEEGSPYLAALVRMAGDVRLDWDAVALAGRGIVAYARAQIWVLNIGKLDGGSFDVAEILEGFALAVEELPEIWHQFDSGMMSEGDLLMRLSRIISYLETWPDVPA
ncbi:hypothetical protein [Streptomyces sp. NPDC097619]|uniref:hypothetical protein n=1 Tax=Streptomyces sp. NPDC097619 TaxID=3157228 RepID=UPI0033341187